MPITNALQTPAAQRAPAEALVLREVVRGARAELEGFIARRFREVYDADVRHFMPRLFGLYQAQHAVPCELVAAFGLRAASEGRLFLEQYLDEPVEVAVARQFGVLAPRARIVEVGNLAGASQGALRRLIPALAARLHAEGFRWIAFTGAAHLCNAFARLGLPLHALAPARPERLCADERAHWGRYYDRHPSVMLGDIARGERTLRALALQPRDLRSQLAPVATVGAP